MGRSTAKNLRKISVPMRSRQADAFPRMGELHGSDGRAARETSPKAARQCHRQVLQGRGGRPSLAASSAQPRVVRVHGARRHNQPLGPSLRARGHEHVKHAARVIVLERDVVPVLRELLAQQSIQLFRLRKRVAQRRVELCQLRRRERQPLQRYRQLRRAIVGRRAPGCRTRAPATSIAASTAPTSSANPAAGSHVEQPLGLSQRRTRPDVARMPKNSARSAPQSAI